MIAIDATTYGRATIRNRKAGEDAGSSFISRKGHHRAGAVAINHSGSDSRTRSRVGGEEIDPRAGRAFVFDLQTSLPTHASWDNEDEQGSS